MCVQEMAESGGSKRHVGGEERCDGEPGEVWV